MSEPLTAEGRLAFIRECVARNPGGYTEDFKFLLATLDAARDRPGLDSDDAEPYEPDPGVDPAYDRLLDAARARPALDVDVLLQEAREAAKGERYNGVYQRGYFNGAYKYAAAPRQREGAGE